MNCVTTFVDLHGGSCRYASGVPGPFDVNLLQKCGSVFLTRPTLWDYISTGDELRERADEVLGWINTGAIKLCECQSFPMCEADKVHKFLEERKSTGKYILVP